MHLGYWCLSLTTNKIYISHGIIFDERVFPFSQHSNFVSPPDNAGIIGSCPIIITPSPNLFTPTKPILNPKSYISITNHVTPEDICSSSQMDNSQSAVNSPSVNTSPSNSSIFQNPSPSPSNPIAITPPTSPPQKLKTIAYIYAHTQLIKLSTQHPPPTCFLASRINPMEPSTHTQALQDLHWTHAMHTKYQALMDNHTWSLVPKKENYEYHWVSMDF